jgi:hypothetical protein
MSPGTTQPLPSFVPAAAHDEVDPFQVSLEVVVATSTMVQHRLEERKGVRSRQDPALTQFFKWKTVTPLRDPEQRPSFVVAPIDVLVFDTAEGPRFQLMELNGTGFGGISNVPGEVVQCFIESIRETAATVRDPGGVFLMGISGLESPERPRLNKLMHEKMMFAQALLEGLRRQHPEAVLHAMPALLDDPSLLGQGSAPAVVMGYMKDFLRALERNEEGQLMLHGRRVAGILNDRFILNILDHFGGNVDLSRVVTLNRCYEAGGDKAVAYGLLNQLLESTPVPSMPPSFPHELAHDREGLILAIEAWLARGERTVIKPHGTGAGHGIEFFLDLQADRATIEATVDETLRLTEAYYTIRGGAFPYTLCPFVDTRVIDQPGHALHGHKYELRIVVYRDGDFLHAFPAVAKVASRPFDPAAPDRLSLINNITAASEAQQDGVSYILPLANRDTLALLGLTLDDMVAVGQAMTRYVRHVLDSLDDPREALSSVIASHLE